MQINIFLINQTNQQIEKFVKKERIKNSGERRK